MLQREPKMNRAPAKDLIPILIQEPSLELLRSFFRARVEWSSYPIFHERMMSSTLFDDYVPLLEQKPEQLSATLDFALTLALEEDERYVLCIVFLIASLCYYAPKEIVPSAAQLQMIEELHERVKPLSFLINLSSFWEAVEIYDARYNPDFEIETKEGKYIIECKTIIKNNYLNDKWRKYNEVSKVKKMKLEEYAKNNDIKTVTIKETWTFEGDVYS
jgi:hypothetical protein